MQKYRLYITLFLSFSLHVILLAFLLIHQKNLGFKKGIGEHRIKASFRTLSEIPQISSSAPIPPQPKPKSTKKPIAKQEKPIKKKVPKEAVKEKKDLKEIPTKEPISMENKTDAEKKEEESLEQALQTPFENLTPQESQPYNTQAPDLQSIEKSLAYQLADPYTKKNISEIYGPEFGQLGTEEQEFIINNLATIGRITQRELKYPHNAAMLKQEGMNVVEFYLHPNGDISDLKIIKPSGFILLDRNSTRTIEIAYKDYPHPKVKTLIRFYISYIMRPY